MDHIICINPDGGQGFTFVYATCIVAKPGILLHGEAGYMVKYGEDWLLNLMASIFISASSFSAIILIIGHHNRGLSLTEYPMT